jgi:hypothetical protein
MDADSAEIYPTDDSRRQIIRRAVPEDLSRLLDIMDPCYPGRSIRRGARWIAWHINNPDSIVLLGPASVSIGCIATRFGYEKVARMEVLCTTKGKATAIEPLRHMRIMTAWAREHNLPLHIASDTGVDLGPIARRLGGREIPTTPRYLVGI